MGHQVRRGGVLAGMLAGLIGCVQPSAETCEGALCPGDFECVADVGCVDPALLGACDGRAAGDDCAASGIPDGVCAELTPGGRLACTAAGCGDGRVVAPEDCEAGVALVETCQGLGYDGGALACDPSCRFDVSGCAGICGDGVVQAAREACEPDVALAETCTDFGFYAGTLACNAACAFDTSGCVGRCGDGVLAPEEGESCEPEPLDLDGQSCVDFGFYRGELGCNGSCGFDLDGCEGTCGDEVLEGDEDCELIEGGAPLLAGAACTDFGYYGGTLGCGGGCRFDLDACAGRCGDGELDEVEQCDGAPPAEGCGALGGLYDRPGCNGGCNADLRVCPELAVDVVAPSVGTSVYYWWTAPDDGSRWGIDVNSGNVYVLAGGDLTVLPVNASNALITDLHVTSSTDVLALDCEGTVSRWDGVAWTVERAGTAPFCSVLGNVHVGPAGERYAAEDGAVFVDEGAGWQPSTLPATGVVDFATCGGKVWALDYGTTQLFRGDEAGWTNTTVPYGGWRLGCDADDTYLWMVGEINGNRWTVRIDAATATVELVALPTFDFLYSLVPLGGARMLAPLGVSGDWVWTGLRWGRLSSRHYATPGSIATIEPVAPADDGALVEVVESSGRVGRLDALVLDHGAPTSVALTAKALWEVTGTELRQRGAQVANVTAGSQVWASDGSRAMLSLGNQVRRCTPSACTAPVTVDPTVASVAQIALDGASDAYLVDNTGRLWVSTGGAWTNLGVTVTPSSTALAVVGPGHVLAASAASVLERAGGGGFSVVYTGGAQLRGLGGDIATSFFAVGNGGTIVERDPVTGTWQLQAQDVTNERLLAVALAGERVLILGDNDTVLQRDALGWMAVDLRRIATGISQLGGVADGSIWLRAQLGLIELVPAPPP
jgi:hypothetical protein